MEKACTATEKDGRNNLKKKRDFGSGSVEELLLKLVEGEGTEEKWVEEFGDFNRAFGVRV